MDPQTVWCPNLDCPARGQRGQGNIGVHSRKERRYHCRVCDKTFGARTGTIFHRRRTDEALIVVVITQLGLSAGRPRTCLWPPAANHPGLARSGWPAC